MADAKREIERKYESDDSGLPDLTGVAGVAAVLDKGLIELDATYYDTADERLAAAAITLRRRTGGADAGWHLKFPVAPGVRDEIQAPLSDTVPGEIAALLRSRVRDAELIPLVRLRSARDVRHLVDADGTLLAEASVDAVTAERLTGKGRAAQWTEIEVELADGGDPAFLDQVEKRLRRAGVRPSASPSKLARALEQTTGRRRKAKPRRPVTAGDHVLAYLRVQRDALVELDPAVRRDLPDSVHRMRVATRRARSTLRTFRAVLDPVVTDPVAAELKWLAGELGVHRDREVLAERLTTALAALPPDLVTGPVPERLTTWANAQHGGASSHLNGVLDSRRHLTLLDTLDRLLADPPLGKAAAKRPERVLARAVHKDLAKLSGLIGHALDLPPGPERDLALHEARKKAKRTRYAAEAATPALGARARSLTRSMKSLTTLLGDHQDSVMARRTLRELSAVAHAAGESSFTYGVLYGREEVRAATAEAQLPDLWREIVPEASG
ncbi:CHAD domain-containing protein [Streptomyces pluripotens]|uniref:CHAD domain-containing protein n=1 Tax=Streptomyces pluripotens TaxID=1355015 RepID=A0A221NWZ4_9ACTN|nr:MULTISPECIES: CYTH and CHAD domain-containing protein [Streptomyces]ARP70211.1 CHAD domain-containing protein [Streptomyces pluripotens]ASN24470.1 CHAD domain-containing protein [Streptomyces pluripotens]KIE27994.1 metal-binding protein [Streptomyces sp. MUSC 125]MCH0558301.1 CYTH and CHAD domain-containing protein [Streptomyces sp. MUM 16J]